MASRVGAIITLSCRLAPLRRKPSGVPRASVTRWRFVPALPRSVGFGPVAEPLFWPGQRRCPSSPAASRSHLPRAGAPRAPDAGGPTRRPPASRADVASNSSRSRSPSLPAASPTGRLSASHEQNAGQRSSVLDRPTAAFWTRPGWRQKRRNLGPEIIRQKRTSHHDQRLPKRSVPVLLDTVIGLGGSFSCYGRSFL